MVKVLIVDDSVTFRAAIKAALKDVPGLEVIGVAANGKIALAKLKDEGIDLITLDLEMPEMDGIETLKEIRTQGIKVKTVVFAAPTEQAYGRVREALSLGALDFVAKPISTNEGGLEEAVERIRSELLPRLQAVAGQSLTSKSEASVASLSNRPGTPYLKKDVSLFSPKALVIASSTGGPLALEVLFSRLGHSAQKIPIFICQHMPKPFTAALAQRLKEISGLDCREGVNGELIQDHRVYIAPAEYHMRLIKGAKGLQIELFQGSRINHVIPAADPLFVSAAEIYGTQLGAIVLTGMGEDGKRGAMAIKEQRGAVMIQNKESSVVWGMPGACFEVQAYDFMGDLEHIVHHLLNWLHMSDRRVEGKRP